MRDETTQNNDKKQLFPSIHGKTVFLRIASSLEARQGNSKSLSENLNLALHFLSMLRNYSFIFGTLWPLFPSYIILSPYCLYWGQP